jgi:glycosyltransferase involved in cell wall biosynthesis
MRVAVNAYSLAEPQTRGWARYTVNLLAALPRHGVRPLLLARLALSPVHLGRLPSGSFDVETAPPMSYCRWEQWWVPRTCWTQGAALYHCPLNFGVPALCPVPRVLTLHDAIDELYPAPRTPWWRRLTKGGITSWAYPRIARTVAEHVITVSAHARGDLVEKLGLPPDRVTVIPEAADPVFLEPVTEAGKDAVRAKWGLTRPYVFYVGGWEERKNIPFLLRGFAAAELAGVELVLAGGRDEERSALMRLAAELRIADRVRLLGFVPDAELPAAHAAALGFVYPSCYEGFGLQLVEAMAVGCPVLAARATCLPEVLGTGGETFGLDDPGELVSALKKLASEPEYRATLSSQALRRAAEYSWDRTAAETVAVYRAVLAQATR